MANQKRQKYKVLVPFPTGGGHWSTKGAELELLDVQARQLVTAGRLEPVAAIAEEASVEAVSADIKKKSTSVKGSD